MSMELNKKYPLVDTQMWFTPIARRAACYIGWIDDPAYPEPVPAWTINKVNIHDAITGRFYKIY